MQLLQDIWNRITTKIGTILPSLIPIYSKMKFRPMEQLFGNNDEEDKYILTDGEDIYYVKEYVLKAYRERNLKQLETELVHVLLHKMLGHCKMKRELKNQELFDVCADMEVNQFMRNLKQECGMESDSIQGEMVYGSCKELYAKYNEKVLLGEATVEGIRQRYAVEKVDSHQRWLKYSARRKQHFGSAPVQKVYFHSANNAEKMSPSMLGHGAENGKKPQSAKLVQDEENGFEWLLKKLVKPEETNKEDEEQFDKALYHFGFEQYGDVALIEPSEDVEDKQRLDTLVIAIDVSGSCQGTLVESFLKAIKKLFWELRKGYTIEHIVLLQCDTQIQEERNFISIEDFMMLKEIKLKGFGGTDFRPVFQRVNQLSKKERIGALLYFSDGCGEFPNEEAPYKTIFLLDDSKYSTTKIPKWIETYRLTESRR